MEGWNGGRRSSWSYLEETASIVSSSSGTIVSTAYTSNVSRRSTSSVEAAMHSLSLGIHEDVNGNNLEVCEEAEDEEAEEDHIRSLVQKFFSAPSADCSIRVGDIRVVERWLKELGVGWVLSLDGGASAAAAAGEEEFDLDARRWSWALGHIAQTFCFMMPHFRHHDSMGVRSMCLIKGEHVRARCVPDQYHLVLFILETMSKILNFVDFLVSRVNNNKLITLLLVHDALSEASSSTLLEFHSRRNAVKVRRMENEIAILLLAYENKLCEAIRSTMEKITTELMTELKEDGDDPSSKHGSSDVHKFTRSAMTYINYSSMVAAKCDKYLPPVKNERPLIGMLIEMVSCLQEKLTRISESFPDHGLRFLFLLNNSYSIKMQLNHHTYSFYLYTQTSIIQDVDHKTEAYMERYLQVSWAPLLSCLFNPTPLCLGMNYSLLSKFESEFQKIFSTQKQWKVPDPKLRRRLREVITDKIIPGYTEYIEDNKVTNPKFSPQELNTMLQELFDG